MAAAQTVAQKPNGDGGRKQAMIALTARLSIFATAEVAEWGAAWVMV